MRHYPAQRFHPRLAAVHHFRRPTVPMRARLFWFALGFFACANVAGFLAGVFHWPN
jgi:hypothetical protein